MAAVSIPSHFPNSASDPFEQTSPIDYYYNCIAWAYGSNKKWYWPSGKPEHFWPPDIPLQETVDAFIKLYESIEYEVCPDGELEKDYEKVAIFTKDGIPTHAARQLSDGKWTSKLGQQIDVSHSIFSIINGTYGDVEVYMKRRTTANN